MDAILNGPSWAYHAPGPNIRNGYLGTSSSQPRKSHSKITCAVNLAKVGCLRPVVRVGSSDGSLLGLQSMLIPSMRGSRFGWCANKNSRGGKTRWTHVA